MRGVAFGVPPRRGGRGGFVLSKWLFSELFPGEIGFECGGGGGGAFGGLVGDETVDVSPPVGSTGVFFRRSEEVGSECFR